MSDDEADLPPSRGGDKPYPLDSTDDNHVSITPQGRDALNLLAL
jgi:hypothetical protein